MSTVFVAALTGACHVPDESSLTEDESSHTARVLERGKLTMLCFPVLDSSFVRPKLDVLEQLGIPLRELKDGDAYEGTEIELISAFARFLGVKLEIEPITTNYKDLIAGVVEQRGDLAASSLSITEERQKIVDFADALGSVWAVVVTRLDGQELSLEELAGKTIRGNRGSSQVEHFRRMGPPDAKLELSDYTLDNYTAVTEGRVDFMLMDSHASIGEPASDAYPEVKVMIRLAETRYGVAFPKGSDLRERYNDYFSQRPADSN